MDTSNATSEMTATQADDWLGLADKVCVVTGGGSGVGAGVAHALGALGAQVAVLDRDAATAQTVSNEITRAGGRAMALVADVSNPEAVAAAAEQLWGSFGPCRVLVNNAALVLGSTGALMEADLALWQQTIDVNLTGSLLCTRAFAAQMIAAGQGGSIVNVASICGHIPRPEGGAYSPSKAGLLMLTRLLALELGAHHIRCNSVSPGWVRTPASEAAYRNPEIGETRKKMVPLGRISDAADMANAITFLASERASYISGQDILVDGGLSQTLMSLVPKPAKPMRPAG